MSNIVEVARELFEGKKAFVRELGHSFPVHMDAHGFLAFDDGSRPPVHIQDLLTDAWEVVDE